jgi:hypothetical protein
MATNPNFAQTPKFGAAAVATNTNRDGTTGTYTSVWTAAATYGSRLEKIRVVSSGQPANSCVTIWLDDGTTKWLFDEFRISSSPAAGSTTVDTFKVEKRYDMDIPASYIIRAAVTVAATSGSIIVQCFANDYAA